MAKRGETYAKLAKERQDLKDKLAEVEAENAILMAGKQAEPETEPETPVVVDGVDNVKEADSIKLFDLPELPEDRPEIRVSHRYRVNPTHFDNYFLPDRNRFGYFWHDVMLVETQGWGIWVPVTKKNHQINEHTRIHVDGTIRCGTLIACYAFKEDVDAFKADEERRTNQSLGNVQAEFYDEIGKIARERDQSSIGAIGSIKEERVN